MGIGIDHIGINHIEPDNQLLSLVQAAASQIGPVQCGDVRLDNLAIILFEARRSLLLHSPVVTMECLNIALDTVCDMQIEKAGNL